MLEEKNIDTGHSSFRVFMHNTADEKSLVYNDIIHMFQDNRGNLWFGTFGGGADMLQKFDGQKVFFNDFDPEIVTRYSIIFGMLEDNSGKIWLSSENGLIRYDPESGSSEFYNNFNGLGFDNFSENTCYKRQNQSSVFGGNLGFEVIRPEKIIPLSI